MAAFYFWCEIFVLCEVALSQLYTGLTPLLPDESGQATMTPILYRKENKKTWQVTHIAPLQPPAFAGCS